MNFGVHIPGMKHAVATVDMGNRFKFFDPNGGVMQFSSRDAFKKWFVAEYKNAEDNGYNLIQEIEVNGFKPTIWVG